MELRKNNKNKELKAQDKKSKISTMALSKKAQDKKSKISTMALSKKAQDKKSKISTMALSKKAQEEMVGFVLIVILVIIVLVIFLGISMRNPVKESIESYEVDNFMQVFLFYTTDCSDSLNNHIIIRDLIKKCSQGKECSDGRDTCDVLNKTASEIMNLIWSVGPESQYKGYELNISSGNEKILYLEKGNKTYNWKGPKESLGYTESEINIKIYY